MTKKKTYLILDGNALLHRAWHALPKTMTRADGTIVNAAYGFTMIVDRMLQTIKPDYMAVAWDLPGKTFRHEEFAEYKATRVKKEQELYDQIPIIQEILNGYGIPSLSSKGYEADDLIGTVAKLNEKNKDIETVVVTGDLDTMQLVNNNTKVLFFVKGVSETKTYDLSAVKDRYRLSPEQVIDLKALMGDPSDNIAGVAGVGKKTATELLQEFGSVEGIFKALKNDPESIKPAWRKKLEGQEKHALKMKWLVTIATDVNLKDYKLSDATVHEPDKEKLVQLFRDLEFRRLLKKYGEKETKETKVVKGDRKHANARPEELRSDALAIAIEAQAEDLFGGKVKSIALSDGKQGAMKVLPTKKDIEEYVKIALNTKLLIGHDLKEIFHTLSLPTFNLQPLTSKLFDTKIAAYLLNPSGRGYELTIMAQQELGEKLNENPNAGDAASTIFRLYRHFEKELKKEDLLKIFNEIEMPLVPVLYEMEKIGIELDSEFLGELSKKMHKELDRLTVKIYKVAGKEFNINSPSQLADILFEDLDLSTKKIKRTKTGYSTAASELEKLEDLHPIIKMIMEYRELTKLTGTYIDALPELVKDDGRVHTSFNQAVTATGRLSSSNPNLQNIPIRTKQGREIRKAFVAGSGNRLIAADYSQIELRIVAAISKDKAFIKAFREGADIHTRTAAEILDIPEDKVTKEQRRAAKAINFGILYGMGSRNMAKSTGLSINEAKAFIDKYFQIHPAIQNYIDETKAKAHKDEMVETLFGRKRYFPEINSGVQMVVAAAERMAVNMPTQGTQADLIKMAMVKVHQWIEEDKNLAGKVHILLQVHDELVLEAPKELVDKVAKGVKEIMENIATLKVPLIADVQVGTNWGNMKKWE